MYFFLFLLEFFVWGCSKSKIEADIPAYLSIDSVFVNTNYQTQGSASHKITDIWVYLNDDFIGAFELPVKIPILKQGNHKITIKAGIKVNGIANTRTAYPFYTEYSQYIDLEKNKTIDIKPLFTYRPETIFHWTEDFDLAGISFTYSNDSDTSFKIVTTPLAFEGTSSGAAYLHNSTLKFEAISPIQINIPRSQKPVFLELNYKIDQILIVGIYFDYPAPANQHSLVYLNPTETWNKIYINLTEKVALKPNSPILIFFGLNRNSTDSPANIYMDNIKLISF
ncbi:MAG: hypothetical protein HND27_00665 [Bacteroidetes bacterium]|nr:hypothetical protein [Flavobacteriales bacterium]MCL4815595.1 hypothetical protein [Flavobacteriales bacterium]NOG94267.1 hypothetical protein [Bacteroidota bacterium]WKZ76584.1 MAG: hypothetical protein QY303_06705 [Vicingaceae bacterium]